MRHRLRTEMEVRPRGRHVLAWRYLRALKREMRRLERGQRLSRPAFDLGLLRGLKLAEGERDA